MFVRRLAGRGVFDPAGDRIGKVRDVLTVYRSNASPRVVGLVVEIPGKRRVFVPISRITSIGDGHIIATGLINVRRFAQHGGETRVIAEMLGHEVQLSPHVVMHASPAQTARHTPSPSSSPQAGIHTALIEDAALSRTRSGEWIIDELFVRLARSAGPFARAESKIVRWADIEMPRDMQASHSAQSIIETIVDFKPNDLAEALLELPNDRMIEVVGELSDHRVADALEEMIESDQLAILEQVPLQRAADVLDEMEPDDAADLIAALPAARGEELLDLMEPEEAEDVRRLLEYGPDTAGGLMNPTPIVLSSGASVAEGLARIRRAEVPAAMASAVYATHPPYETPTGEYLGMAHFQRMLRYPPHERLSVLLDREIEPVSANATTAEVARRLASYDLVSLPVVDDQQRLIGVVTIDDVLDRLLPEDWRNAQHAPHTPDQATGGARA